MAAPRILAFAGSLRAGSFNKKLIRIGAEAARAAGGEVTLIDLAEFPMPIYDGDIEQREGIPPHGKRLKRLMIEHDAFLFSCPEYNSSMSAAFKNAIDWASRREPDEPNLVAFTGKVAGLLAASPGALGGLRGLVHVRQMLGNIGVIVVPEQAAISAAAKAFDESGRLVDDQQRARVEKVARRVVQVAGKLRAG